MVALLLLGMGVEPARAQEKTEVAQVGTGQAEAAQAQSAPAQPKTETEPAKGEGPQAKTDAAAQQTEVAEARTDKDGKLISTPGSKALGMSILGNQEAPTSLVIVPWKSSELGGALGITPILDDSRQPVDRDVFMRALRYYEIRSGTTK